MDPVAADPNDDDTDLDEGEDELELVDIADAPNVDPIEVAPHVEVDSDPD